MKMKKTIYILAIIGLILGACDKIDEPFLEETGSGPGPDPVEKVRKVVLEEFTGHICVNCPEATKLARDLKTVFGEQLILISIHAGDLAVPQGAPYETEYRTQAGTDIYNYYAPIGVPTGMVNRMPYQGSTVLFKDSWEPAIQELLDTDPEAFIEIENEYYDESRKLDIHVHAEFLETLDIKVNLSVLIIESGMISAQKNDLASIGDVPDILDYEHAHVLRTAVNGTWGEELYDSPESGMLLHKDLTITLDNGWDADKIEIIALLLNGDTYEVIQAEEIGLNFQ